MSGGYGITITLVAAIVCSGAAEPTCVAETRSGSERPSPRIKAPLRALSANPNYFTDGSGRAIYLTGSHTWNNLQDWGTDGVTVPFNFTEYVNFLKAHHHNFTLIWTTELPTFHGLPTTAASPPDFTVTPQPWRRTGAGAASDGKPKFDLTKFNPDYFNRLRARVKALNAARIYAGVYLFTGEWLNAFRFAGDGYPFTGTNNVNGIDDGGGVGSVSMKAPNAVTEFQDAYVRKVIDTLNDLPNVLWIVSEEAPASSTWWNGHLIALTRSYEARKPLQHPIGYAALADLKDETIHNSDADWIAPAARISPPVSIGAGHPARKVNVNDSDHSYWEIWNDAPQVNRNYFWINFTNGNQTLFMDPYVVYYPRQNRNLCPNPVHGIGAAPDPRWENVRATMGYIRDYADRLDLAAMSARNDLASTGHVLAGQGDSPREILVYAPNGGRFTVDLSRASGRFSAEWMNPVNGRKSTAADVPGGAVAPFTPPFAGDAVLCLTTK